MEDDLIDYKNDSFFITEKGEQYYKSKEISTEKQENRKNRRNDLISIDDVFIPSYNKRRKRK